MDVHGLSLEGGGGLGLFYGKVIIFLNPGIVSINLKQNGALGFHKFYKHKLANLL